MPSRDSSGFHDSSGPVSERAASSAHRSRSPKRPEFHQLSIFLTVAEARSFAGAARLLGLTQPAISQAIARLEDLYGGDLFERRRGAALEPTPIAEAILPSARTLLKTVDQQLIMAARAASSQTGTLTLGSSVQLSGAPLREGITDFITRCPGTRLKLVEDAPAQLLSQLHARFLDIVLLPLPTALPDNSLVYETLWSERLMVALPCGHPLADDPVIAWADLAHASVLVCAADDTAVRTVLQESAANSAVAYETHDVSRDTLLAMVSVGMGLAIVGDSSASPQPHIVFRAINDQLAAIAVAAVWPHSDGNPLRHRLLDCIRKSGKSAQSGALTQIFPSKVRGSDRG